MNTDKEIQELDEIYDSIDTKLDLFNAVLDEIHSGKLKPEVAHLNLATRLIDLLLKAENMGQRLALQTIERLTDRAETYKLQRDEHFCVLVEQMEIHPAGHC